MVPRRARLLALAPLALALCTAAFQPALLHRAHRPARALAIAPRSAAAARLQPTSPFPQRQQPARRKRRRRRTGPEIETMVVKTVALAVAGGALRSVVPGVLPLASLTFVAGLVLRALPTGTIEALLFAAVLFATGLGNYFPFNFVVWFAGGAGFFGLVYECNVSVERWQRARRARQPAPSPNPAPAPAPAPEPKPKPKPNPNPNPNPTPNPNPNPAPSQA